MNSLELSRSEAHGGSQRACALTYHTQNLYICVYLSFTYLELSVHGSYFLGLSPTVDTGKDNENESPGEIRRGRTR